MSGRAQQTLGSAAVLAGAGMTLADRLAILYLALPVALFFFTWLKPVYGVPLGLAALAGLPALRPPPGARVAPPTLAAVALLAFGWAALSNASHFFYAGGALNWPIRDAVLRDLVLYPQPAAYAVRDSAAVILRAPIAYYLLPALGARALGLAHAHLLLYLWTALGVLLFLLQVAAGERRPGPLLLIGAVVVLFGGMDLLSPADSQPGPAGPWTPVFYQSSYNTNLLIGFPSHAIPGWLAIALYYRCRDDPAFLRIAAWVGALTLLWAPLVSVGLLPFCASVAWRQRGARFRPLLSPCNLLAAPAVAAASALYLTAAAGTIGSAIALPPGPGALLSVYGPFVLAEFGALALALLWSRPGGIDPPFFALALLTLLALPWFHFGPNNDLVNRGAIPALAVLMFAVVDGWARPPAVGGRGLLVGAMLLIGAAMPAARIAETILRPAWTPDLQRSLYEVTGGRSPNYLALLPPDSPLAALLRRPAPVPP